MIEFQRPILNTNPMILGRKDKILNMSVVDSRAISSNWYLYAYIDNPLTETNNEHTLPESLIFVDTNNEIKTLGVNPTLVYLGTPNEDNTKTTNISWSENSGILFKIIEPLYNGETYSTLIHWTLTSEILS